MPPSLAKIFVDNMNADAQCRNKKKHQVLIYNLTQNEYIYTKLIQVTEFVEPVISVLTNMLNFGDTNADVRSVYGS